MSEINRELWVDRAERNLRWYPTYIILSGSYFWLAIFFLFFKSELSLTDVLRVEAIYYFAVFLLEVPSGYFSDKFRRVISLRISALSFLASYLIFYFASSFWDFAFAQIMLANGIAFSSGTLTSFHYASLEDASREEEYSQREAKYGFLTSIAGASAVFLGGVIAVYDFRMAYGLNAFVSLLTIFVVFFVFRETHHDVNSHPQNFRSQFGEIIGALKDPMVRFLFFVSLSMIVLVHIPYEYYQLYLTFLDDEFAIFSTSDFSLVNVATISTGIHAAIVMLVSSIFAGLSVTLYKKLGSRVSFLSALIFITILIFLMGNFVSLWIVFLLFFRSAPAAFLKPIFHAEVVPRLRDGLRATFLSTQSMLGRVGFSILLIGLSFVPAQNSIQGNFSTMLNISSVLAVVLIIVAFLLAPKKTKKANL